MKNKKLLSGVMTAALMMMGVAGVMLGATSTASAQYRYRYNENEIRQMAYREGFQAGIREGRQDARARQRFSPNGHRGLNDWRSGYRGEFRNERIYRDAFRNGFLAGYRQGYNNAWDRRGNGWGNGRFDNDYRWPR